MASGLALPGGQDESGGAGRVSGGHRVPGQSDFLTNDLIFLRILLCSVCSCFLCLICFIFSSSCSICCRCPCHLVHLLTWSDSN